MTRRTQHWTTAAAALAGACIAAPAAADYKAGMDALATRDYARARAEFESDRANPAALYQLSRLAGLGLGEPRDDARRADLLRQAAELGHRQARMEYVVIVGSGRGVPADPQRALRMLEDMVAEGRMDATVYLGRALRFGFWGLPKDEPRSAALFARAAEAGDEQGMAMYAQALLDGVGVAKDPARAVELLKKGVEHGTLDAQLEYARLLTFGIAVPKDEAAGTALYRKAAETGDSTAQFAVGMAYLGGRGVPRDDATGARWIDAAARQGSSWAQLRLGDLFRTGIGVPRLPKQAYYWYTIAANSTSSAGEQARERRAQVARELSASDIEAQVRRAEAFRPQPGLRPREEALPPLARGEQVTVGPVTIAIPAPRGYVNSWEFVEFLQRVSPNDPDMRPRLMVLMRQDDLDRFRLGLPGPLRSIEFSRHLPDDKVAVTPALFADIRKQMRTRLEANANSGRFRVEATVRDDDQAYAFVRSAPGQENKADAFALVLVQARLVAIAFTGFERQDLGDLQELAAGVITDILARNKGVVASSQ